MTHVLVLRAACVSLVSKRERESKRAREQESKRAREQEKEREIFAGLSAVLTDRVLED